MISGDPRLRTFDSGSSAQQAVTYICLNFSGKSSKHNELPENIACPAGIRSQIVCYSFMLPFTTLTGFAELSELLGWQGLHWVWLCCSQI